VSASPGLASAAPTGSEEAMRAGSGAEQRVADELGRALGQEWVLFRGYRNGRGEIDGVLLGPGGLFAYEVKYHNATVYISGDAWAGEKYDNYGNLVEPRRPIVDRGSRGRSPSQQLNEPASALAAWLSRRGHPVDIARVVLLTHPKARIGVSNGATVRVVTSAAALLRLVQGSGARLGARQRAEIEQVIRRDHQHFNGRKR
jgi:nuclease-like protein